MNHKVGPATATTSPNRQRRADARRRSRAVGSGYHKTGFPHRPRYRSRPRGARHRWDVRDASSGEPSTALPGFGRVPKKRDRNPKRKPAGGRRMHTTSCWDLQSRVDFECAPPKTTRIRCYSHVYDPSFFSIFNLPRTRSGRDWVSIGFSLFSPRKTHRTRRRSYHCNVRDVRVGRTEMRRIRIRETIN